MKKLLPLLAICASCSTNPPSVKMNVLESGTEALLQAISIVDSRVIWVSGHNATFCRTTDGGSTWSVFKHASDTLQFRDIHAFNRDEVILMSAGPGSQSQIFHFDATTSEYSLQYLMKDSSGFLNTIEFWDSQNGLAFGDAISDQLFILKTLDGGRNWDRIPPDTLPKAGKGEGGFAASGTCIETIEGGLAWIGTGAGGNSRVLKTMDYGNTWEEYHSPLIKGSAAGITSIRMSGPKTGFITGGDLALTDEHTPNTAITKDGGLKWALTNHPLTVGAFYGSDIQALKENYFTIVCGPNGADYSFDLGNTWNNLDSTTYWAVEVHTSGWGIMTGPKGKIVRIEID